MNTRPFMRKVLSSTLWVSIGVVTFFISFLGAAWLFSYATAQRYAPGEMPHKPFYVAYVPGAHGAAFDAEDLRHVEPSHVSFLLPTAQDEIFRDGQQIGYDRYRVLEKTATSQRVELQHHTDDYDFWSRCRATKDTVVPLYSRIIGPATGVVALPVAVLPAYFIVRLLQRLVRARRGRSENA